MISFIEGKAIMERVFSECMDLREKAQKEYAHDPNNILANFERSALDLKLPREKTWAVLARKHWDGIIAWIGGYRSQRESVKGRIKDMIVYLVLLYMMVEEDEKKPSDAALVRLEEIKNPDKNPSALGQSNEPSRRNSLTR